MYSPSIELCLGHLDRPTVRSSVRSDEGPRVRRAQATAFDRHHHRLTSGQFQYGGKRNVEGLPAIDWSDQKARQTQVACNARTVLHFASKHLVYLRADQQHDVSSTRRLRAWKTNLLQVLQAVLFVFVIWAVDKAITYSRERMPAFSQVHSPSATAVASIPDCAQNQYLKACSTLRRASCCFKALLLLTASSCASLDYAVTCWIQPLLYASLHAQFACATCVCHAMLSSRCVVCSKEQTVSPSCTPQTMTPLSTALLLPCAPITVQPFQTQEPRALALCQR